MSMLPCKLTVECGKGRTKKIAVEHDINKLIAKYQKTGILPIDENRQGVFVDVAQVGDFQDCQNRVKAAEEHFMTLPSKVRRKFGGSPEAFMDYIQNLTEKDTAEAIELGLVIKKEPPNIENKKEIKTEKEIKKGGDDNVK